MDKIRAVRVALGARSYDIRIGQGFADVLSGLGDYKRAVLVADSNTGPLYADAVGRVLSERGIAWSPLLVPAGEPSKSLAQVGVLLEAAVEAGLDRRCLVVALGGGVVGDLAGFVAAIYLRGVPFMQLPTSLLAMVDSAVGGKTGVNLPQGKNLVGAFYQPVQVGVNLDTLLTLPDREYRSGLAEVVKYGILHDAAFFAELERQVDAMLGRDPEVLQQVVARCCEIKADVVRQDEREGGLRAILNYGHTLGHALEAVLGYGQLLHGEAVAIGMIYANTLSERICGFPAADAERVKALLVRMGLPVSCADLPLEWQSIRAAMATDKKASEQVPLFVLAQGLGRVQPGLRVDEVDLEKMFSLGMQ